MIYWVVGFSLLGVLTLADWLEKGKQVCNCGWPASKHKGGKCER